MAKPNQLYLLADHAKLLLLERQRRAALGLDRDGAAETQITSALAQLRDGLAALEADGAAAVNDDNSSTRLFLRSQLDALTAEFGDPATAVLATTAPRSLLRSPAGPLSPASKTVRFSDSTPRQFNGGRYRDEPGDEPAAVETRDNPQLHAYHTRVLADQDAQLDSLGQSIDRQRHLSIQIGDELDDHIDILDRVDAAVDRHQSRIDRASRVLGRVARGASESKQMVVILVLIVILVLLIAVLK